MLGGVSLLLVAAVIAGLVALDQRGQRHARSARVAEAQRLGALALSEHALDRSLLLARAGVALDDSAGHPRHAARRAAAQPGRDRA